MLSVYATEGVVNDKGLVTDLTLAWDKVQQLKDGPLALLSFTEGRTEVLTQESTMVQSLADTCKHQSRVHRALNPPDSFDTTTVEELEAYILQTFPRENLLRKESTRNHGILFLMLPWNILTSGTGIRRLRGIH